MPLSRLRVTELFAAYVDCMRRGVTVRASAGALVMSLNKAFRWRHRFLANAIDPQSQKVSGLLELDESYFRPSGKVLRTMTRTPRRCGGGHGGGGGRSGEE